MWVKTCLYRVTVSYKLFPVRGFLSIPRPWQLLVCWECFIDFFIDSRQLDYKYTKSKSCLGWWGRVGFKGERAESWLGVTCFGDWSDTIQSWLKSMKSLWICLTDMYNYVWTSLLRKLDLIFGQSYHLMFKFCNRSNHLVYFVSQFIFILYKFSFYPLLSRVVVSSRKPVK